MFRSQTRTVPHSQLHPPDPPGALCRRPRRAAGAQLAQDDQRDRRQSASAAARDWLFRTTPRPGCKAISPRRCVNSVILTGGTIARRGHHRRPGRLLPWPASASPAPMPIGFYLLVGTSVPALLFMVPLFFHVGAAGTGQQPLRPDHHLHRPQRALRHLPAALVHDLRSRPTIEEAARIDGASDLQVFTQIIVPLSWPGFFTMVLVVGLAVWNEFLFAVTFLQREELKPIATSVQAFQSRYSARLGPHERRLHDHDAVPSSYSSCSCSASLSKD